MQGDFDMKNDCMVVFARDVLPIDEPGHHFSVTTFRRGVKIQFSHRNAGMRGEINSIE